MLYFQDENITKEKITNKIFDIFAFVEFKNESINFKYQKRFNETRNDLIITVNEAKIGIQLENIFLYMLENFSDNNYNNNPKSYKILMYKLGKLVLISNAESSKLYRGSSKIQEIKERE
jgi:hypothetical protein